MILKTLRLDHGLTQQSLCKQIGITPSVYARYEHDEYCPSTDIVVKIAQFYGISIELCKHLRLKIDVDYPNGFIWPLIEPFGYIHLRLKQLFKAWCTVVHLFILLIFEGVQLYTLLIWIISAEMKPFGYKFTLA